MIPGMLRLYVVACALLVPSVSLGAAARGASDCCVAHPTPGCDDPGCQSIVCGFDSFCCDSEWDAECASSAADLCPVCAVDTDGDGIVDNIDNCPDTFNP